MQKKLFIFDLDGTLINSKEDIADSVNALLLQLGKPQKSLEEITAFVGQGVVSLLKKSLPDVEIGEIKTVFFPQFEKIYSENLTKKTKLYSGVLDIFRKIDPKTQKVGVLTHKPKNLSVRILEYFEISEKIFLCLGGDELEHRKPHPEGLLRIMEAAKVSPEETVFMGDSGEDMEAGKAAKVTTVAALYGFRPVAELVRFKPDHLATEFRDFFTFNLI